MEQGGLTAKELEPMIGQRNRVYEILNRKRSLTLPMIWKLHQQLGIPAESQARSQCRTLKRICQHRQCAVEAHFYGDSDPILAASTPDQWASSEDYQGGFWMLVDIDLSRVNAKAVRLNISLPENLVHRIDASARERRMSRSAFLATAAEREMAVVK